MPKSSIYEKPEEFIQALRESFKIKHGKYPHMQNTMMSFVRKSAEAVAASSCERYFSGTNNKQLFITQYGVTYDGNAQALANYIKALQTKEREDIKAGLVTESRTPPKKSEYHASNRLHKLEKKFGTFLHNRSAVKAARFEILAKQQKLFSYSAISPDGYGQLRT